MNGVMRVSAGEPALPAAPHAASGPRPTPVPHGGREMALAMAREAYAWHARKAEEWCRVIEEMEGARR